MRWTSLAMMAAALVVATGCERPVASEKAAPSSPGEPVQAQEKLKTIKLWLGSEELTTEIAIRALQVQTGMMFRTNIAENEGMLFVFGVPHQASFWMKNTIVPLSAAYIDSEGTILEIHDFHPKNTNAVVAASTRVQYVLETSQGWFKRHNVAPGAIVRTEIGTLRQTFFSKR